MNAVRLTTVLLLAAASLARATAVVDTFSKDSAPGQYVTLSYEVQGSGTFTAEVESPPGWTPVTRSRSVTLDGSGFVPVTFKVPDLAPVGKSPPIFLKLLQGGQEVSRGSAFVQVLPQANLGVRVPELTRTYIGEPSVLPVYVTNLGNAPDTVTLRVTNLDNRTQLNPGVLTLKPGETGRAEIVIPPDDTLSDGYIYDVIVQVASGNDPRRVATVRSEVVFVDRNRRAASLDPQLSLTLKAGVDAALVFGDGETKRDLRFYLEPGLQGKLSDFVKGDFSVSPLYFTPEDLLPEVPAFGVNLDAEGWSASLGLDTHGVTLGGALRLGAWKVGPSAALRLMNGTTNYGLGFSAERAFGESTLALGAKTVGSLGEAPTRTDTLAARYSAPLSPNLKLDLAPAVIGRQDKTGYHLDVGASEQLSLQSADYDLTQTYNGSLSGANTLSVSGGNRNVSPFGVRASSSVQLAGDGLTWRSSAVLLASSGSGLGASLGGVYQYSSRPSTSTFYSLTPAASAGFRLGSASLSLSASYTFLQTIPSPLGPSQSLGASASLGVGNWQFGVSGGWDSLVSDGARQTTWHADGEADWALSARDTLSLTYAFKNRPAEFTDHTLGASWEHSWTKNVLSRLQYGRGLDIGANGAVTTPESLGVSLAVNNLLPNTALGLSYGLSATNGILSGEGLRHSVRLGLSYDFGLTFNTPRPIVNLFGGRVGGELHGTVFRDDNLSGTRDPGEAALPGVTVKVGGVETTTDAAGNYRLMVPQGSYEVEFPSGVPTTLDVLAPIKVTVGVNSSQALNLPLAAVSTVDVLVFHDLNNNKNLDEGEEPLPFAAVTATGATSQSVTADSRGVAHLSGLPSGQYALALDPKGLPEGYVPSGGAIALNLKEGERPPMLTLGAAEPPKQLVSTFNGNSIGVLGRAEPNFAPAGQDMDITVRLQGEVQDVTVEAFGAVHTAEGSGDTRSLRLTVPPGTAPGVYDVVVTAKNGSASKSTVIKVTVQSAS